MFRLLPGKCTQPADWLATPRARLFLQYERHLLQDVLPSLTGYRCVQIGVWGHDRSALARAGTLCQWTLGFADDSAADIRFDGARLPLASASVDAVVLAHALEQVPEPHVLLRECARVLNDRGQLIVLVFNPLSLWWWRQGLPARRQPGFMACSPPPSASRLFDWLRLLAFEPEQIWRYGLGFPLFGGRHAVGRDRGWARCVAWSAQAYVVAARRYVCPPTRIGKPARRRVARPAVALARHSSGRVPYRR